MTQNRPCWTRLRDEVERTQPDLLPWLPLIAIVLDVDVPTPTEVEQLAAESRAAKLHEVVLRFLGRALVVPTIVAVEHAHLMDAASAALFGALARRARLLGLAGRRSPGATSREG